MSVTQTRWLTPAQQRAWRSLLVGHALLLDRLDHDLRLAHDLSLAEYEVLVRLSEAPHRRVRMAQLASAIGHSRSRVTHTVARMEEAGLVVRRPCADDGRGVEACLTDSGYATLAAAAETHVAGVRAHLVDLCAPEDLEAVERVFGAVADDLTGPDNAAIGTIRG